MSIEKNSNNFSIVVLPNLSLKNQRPGNAGGVGNTLEDLLDVAENNLQLPDFGDWELKSQRADTGSLLTLFHTEPQPRAAKIVPQILLLKYGWPHQEAGTTYPANERSFRQTINATAYSGCGRKRFATKAPSKRYCPIKNATCE